MRHAKLRGLTLATLVAALLFMVGVPSATAVHDEGLFELDFVTSPAPQGDANVTDEVKADPDFDRRLRGCRRDIRRVCHRVRGGRLPHDHPQRESRPLRGELLYRRRLEGYERHPGRALDLPTPPTTRFLIPTTSSTPSPGPTRTRTAVTQSSTLAPTGSTGTAIRPGRSASGSSAAACRPRPPIGEAGTGQGYFTYEHSDGDILVLANFRQGGRPARSASTVGLARRHRQPPGSRRTAIGGLLVAPLPDDFCAVVTTRPAEPALGLHQQGRNRELRRRGALVEGGINVSDVLFPGRRSEIGCFSSFLAATRSAHSGYGPAQGLSSRHLGLQDRREDRRRPSKVGDDVNYTITVENTGQVTLHREHHRHAARRPARWGEPLRGRPIAPAAQAWPAEPPA